MRITFAVPFVNLTGGIRLVVGYANWLHDAGHDVEIIHPLVPYAFHFTWRQRLGELRKAVHAAPGIAWCDLRCRVRRVPVITSTFVPDADVVVATSWPVSESVSRLPASCGTKVQLLFHHEGGTGPEDRIRGTYRPVFHRIAFAETIRREFEQQFDCRIDAVVPAGFDNAVFFPDGERSEDTVLMLYHNDPRKGAADGIQALTRLKHRFPRIRVRMCGTVPAPNLPSWIDFALCPNDAELRQLFSTSSVLLYPSRYEGFGLPPLEAMACGCPVVSSAVGAVPEYAIHKTDAWLVAPGDIEGMTEGLVTILTNDGLREMFAARGPARASDYSMSRAALLFEQELTRAAVPKHSPSASK